ncbi:34611_t:CDS:2, partial [Gigaspora margarita]
MKTYVDKSIWSFTISIIQSIKQYIDSQLDSNLNKQRHSIATHEDISAPKDYVVLSQQPQQSMDANPSADKEKETAQST